jgi:hypothetical protein
VQTPTHHRHPRRHPAPPQHHHTHT